MRTWCAVVPQKAFAIAKGRVELDPTGRGALARAMLRDTVAALRATPGLARVVVLLDDPQDAAALPSFDFVDTSGLGLNAAIELGVHQVRGHGRHRNVLVVPGDLPALDPLELTVFLSTADAHRRSFLRDRSGTGTTLLAAPDRVDPEPAYGEGSAQAHLTSGAVDLTSGELPTLRSDVDDLASLAGALRLGSGHHTLSWCASRRMMLEVG